MGKGGTKFSGDAVGSRTKWVGYTTKDARKDMEEYQKTGHHPAVERAKRDRDAIRLLPDPKPSRRHVFMDIAVKGRTIGRLVIELYDDLAPVPVGAFQNRCQPDASETFKGTIIHKLVAEQAAWGGRSKAHRDVVQMKPAPQLGHAEKGAVSIARSGAEFVLAFQRAMHLDETHCVVGRVTAASLPVLDQLNALSTLPDDSPVQRVSVAACGSADARGVAAPDADGARSERDLSPGALKRRVAAEAEAARRGVQEALAAGMRRKRGDDEGAAGPTLAKRKGVMGALLSDDESSSSSSGGDDGDKP